MHAAPVHREGGFQTRPYRVTVDAASATEVGDLGPTGRVAPAGWGDIIDCPDWLQGVRHGPAASYP